jgi:hypothetical protein
LEGENVSIHPSKLLLLTFSASLLAACGSSLNIGDAPPSVILGLTSDSTTIPSVFTIVAGATDDRGIAKVEFYDNNQKIGESAAAPYSVTRTYASGDQGAHVIRAVATDTAGQKAEDSKTLTVNPGPTVQISGVVSISRAGAGIAGATVKVEGENVSATTDAEGRYTLKMPITAKNLLITKDGYASTRVENIDTSAPRVLDEILQRSFDPALPSTPPIVTVARQTLDDTGKVLSSIPFVDGDTLDVSGAKSPDLTLEVKTTTASPDLNGPTTGIASFDTEAGSSGYLNAGRTRVLVSSLKGTDTFTFKAADLAAFNGNVDLHINIYDYNGNRTHLIRHVKVVSAPVAKAVVAPTNLAPLAITFADTATYGALSQDPQAGEALQRWMQTKDATGLKAVAAQLRQVQATPRLTPQAAAPGTVVWVDVNFKYDPAAPAPRAFELYRSVDGKQTYTRVLSALPAKVLKDAKKPETGLYVMRDNSAQLTPGTEASYKVRAVSDTPGPDSAPISVTPLGRYEIALGAPDQGATGVETAPIFRWKTTGASDSESLLLLLLDRTQAEGKSFQWQSDVSGQTSAIYNADGAALTPYLQPFHAYDWQLAGITTNASKTAISVGADFFNAFAVTANPVKAGPIHEFVTGGY